MLSTEEAMAASEAARALFPHISMTREKRDAMQDNYNAEHERIKREFRDWLHQEFAPDVHPEAQAAIWKKAWDDAHDGSLRGVADQYEELANIVNFAIQLSQR